MIRYYKLFDLLNRKGMKKSDLRSILSPKTVAKLSKGEYISGEAIDRICLYLECQPNDIMEVYREVSYIDENGEERTKEVLANQKQLKEIKALLREPGLFEPVLNMYKAAAKTEEEQRAIEETEKLMMAYLNLDKVE